MSNKNAFEIRLEILKMAKELAMDEYFAKRDTYYQDWQLQVDLIKDSPIKGNKEVDLPKCPSIKPPTTEEILRKSEELYRFVSN